VHDRPLRGWSDFGAAHTVATGARRGRQPSPGGRRIESRSAPGHHEAPDGDGSGALWFLRGERSSARLAHGPGEHRGSFVLGQSAPHAVGLAYGKGLLEALLDDGARRAHGLRGLGATTACGTTLALGVEEQGRVGTSTCALVLPLPQVENRAWLP